MYETNTNLFYFLIKKWNRFMHDFSYGEYFTIAASQAVIMVGFGGIELPAKLPH